MMIPGLMEYNVSFYSVEAISKHIWYGGNTTSCLFEWYPYLPASGNKEVDVCILGSINWSYIQENVETLVYANSVNQTVYWEQTVQNDAIGTIVRMEPGSVCQIDTSDEMNNEELLELQGTGLFKYQENEKWLLFTVIWYQLD